MSQHLGAINAQLDPHEQLDCLVVVSTAWTVDNGFITPTFKDKRNRIDQVYAPMFDCWTRAPSALSSGATPEADGGRRAARRSVS